MSEIGFGSVFPAGLFDVHPGTPVPPQTYEPGEHAGPEPPAVINIAPGSISNAVPQGDVPSGPAGSADTVPTEAAINHGFGLILLLVLIVLGLWLLFRSGQ